MIAINNAPSAVYEIVYPSGKPVQRLQFGSAEELEVWFLFNMIGNPEMKGHSSKAIGNVLLVWENGR